MRSSTCAGVSIGRRGRISIVATVGLVEFLGSMIVSSVALAQRQPPLGQRCDLTAYDGSVVKYRAEEIQKALADSEALARRLGEAIGKTPAGEDGMELTRTAYCGRARSQWPLPGVADSCASAKFRIKRSGQVQVMSDTCDQSFGAGTWCLDPEDGSWGGRQIVFIRTRGQPDEAATCFDAKVGTTYRAPGSDGDRVAVMRVWASRSYDDLAFNRKQSREEAENLLKAYAKVGVYAGWADYLGKQLQSDPSAKAETIFQGFRSITLNEPVSPQTGPRSDALEDIRKALPDEFKSDKKPTAEERARLCAYAAQNTRAEGTPGGLAAAALPAVHQHISALRKLVLANQASRTGQRPSSPQLLPFPVFEGELPAVDNGRALVTFSAATGRSEAEALDYGEDERVTFFATELRPDRKASDGKATNLGDRVALLPGDKRTQAASDVAIAVGGLLRLAPGVLSQAQVRARAITKGVFVMEPVLEEPFLVPSKCTVDAACRGEAVCKGVPHTVEPWKALCLTRKPPSNVIDVVTWSHALLRTDGATGTLNPTDAQALIAEVRTLYRDALTLFLGAEFENAGGEASALYTSRVIRSGLLAGATAYELRICRGVESCTKDASEGSIAASVQLEASPHHPLVSTVTELALNVPFAKDTPAGGYGWDPVGGAGGLDQLYRLSSRDSAADHATVSQFLMIFPAYKSRHRWLAGIGAGPGVTLFRGDDVEILKQWNFRVGWETPWTRGLLVQVGASLRYMDVPVSAETGIVVAAPRTSAPPTLTTREQSVWMFSAGIAVDLGLIGSAGQSLADAISGDKEKP